jgi:succinyl-diaminopimelate desuccinylase
MANPKNTLDLTRDLIRFKTTPDKPDEIVRCLDYVGDFLKQNGWLIEGHESNGVKSIFCGANRTPKVLLAAHLDVVPGEERQFEPSELDRRIYGRGALDMKSGAAALMHLAADIGPNDSLALIFTTDEETGGFDGTKYLLDQGIRPQVVILPDGGKDWRNIVHKEKGVFWVKISAAGKPAHGSTPWLGENAIHKLNQALQSIENSFKPIASHPDDHWVATCNIGRIEGGSANNRVADSAWAVCDIRLTENDDPRQIESSLRSLMPKGVTFEVLLDEPLVFVPQNDPAVTAYAEAIRQQGGEPRFSLDYGSSDARFFTPLRIPVILNQPTGDGNHGPDEWVDAASISTYENTVRAFLRTYADI